MEKYKFNRNKLQRDSADRKVRYKLYKAGTRWLVAGMATLTFGISAFALPTQAKADTASTDGSDSANSSTTNQAATTPKQVTLHNTSSATSTPAAANQDRQGTAVKSAESDSATPASTTQGTATPTNDSKTTAPTAAIRRRLLKPPLRRTQQRLLVQHLLHRIRQQTTVLMQIITVLPKLSLMMVSTRLI